MTKEERESRIKEIEAAMQAADFWTNSREAQGMIKELQELKVEATGGSIYDAGSAVLTIFGGAGGDDAEDFARMLYAMYERYIAERRWGWKVLHENKNDHGGYRNVTIEIEGKGAYGELKNESGVHRLVRLSPFNANQLRHTSFAMVEFIPLFPKANVIAITNNKVGIDHTTLIIQIMISSTLPL